MTDKFASDESRDAASWIARLDRGELNNAEEEELRAWIKADPANAAELKLLASLWDGIADAADEVFEAEPSFETEDVIAGDERPEERLEPSLLPPVPEAANENGTPWVRPAIAASLAAGLLLLGAFFVLRDTAPVSPAIDAHTTAIGEQREIQLADGSIAELNTNSQVAVQYAETERLVHLEYGEAHFEVAKDERRPFRVRAGGQLVEAIGTAFSVRVLENDRLEAIVNEGTVRIVPIGNVRRPGTTLTAGDRYVGGIENAAVTRLEANTIDDSLAWQDGELIFDGEPLSQVVEEIQRYSSRKITIADPAVRSRRVGGYFLTSQADEILSSLEESLQLRVEYLDDEIRISDAAS